MPCDTTTLRDDQTLAERMTEVETALSRLERRLQDSTVQVGIGPNGAIVLKGWPEAERKGLSDACTIRSLTATGSWAMRQAIARAEATSGRKANLQATAAGWHSHDAGSTWQKH